MQKFIFLRIGLVLNLLEDAVGRQRVYWHDFLFYEIFQVIK